MQPLPPPRPNAPTESNFMSDMSIVHTRCPDNPGWMRWDIADMRRFNAVALGKIIMRKVDDANAVVRMFPTIAHSNLLDKVHGGVTLSLTDVALFAAAEILGHEKARGAVTVSLDTQFIGAGDIGVPLDAEVEVIRVTRRLIFLRGIVVQDGGAHMIASFSGIIRRASSSAVRANSEQG